MARSFDGFKTIVQIHLTNKGVKTKKKIAAEVARITNRMKLRNTETGVFTKDSKDNS